MMQADPILITAADIGGMTFTPGTYTFPAATGLTGTLILDDTTVGDFTFIINAAFTTAASSGMTFINGGTTSSSAQVFWSVNGAVTTGANSVSIGSITSILGAVTLGASSVSIGSITSTNGAVTLGANSMANGSIKAPNGAITVGAGATINDSTPIAGDKGIRFNKFGFLDGYTAASGFLPLDASDYPIQWETGTVMKTQTDAISIVTADDFELKGALADPYIEKIGGMPSMPNDNSDAVFWGELEKVVDVQIARRSGASPSDLLISPSDLFTLPDLWTGKDIDEVAEAVHDEYPGHHQVTLIQWLWSEGVKLDYDIIPKRCEFDFIGMQIRLADINTWATRVVSPINFNIKWTAGRPRPEEVAYMIAEDELTVDHGVPSSLVDKVKTMNLKNAVSFTKYAEGSPRHPSWPAMHSAASSSSLWLSVVLDLTDAQRCEALRLDFAVSYARTVAGVHYETDNTAGLNLGSVILSEKLADYLAENYGADRAAVQAKIEANMLDWSTFNSAECSYNKA